MHASFQVRLASMTEGRLAALGSEGSESEGSESKTLPNCFLSTSRNAPLLGQLPGHPLMPWPVQHNPCAYTSGQELQHRQEHMQGMLNAPCLSWLIPGCQPPPQHVAGMGSRAGAATLAGTEVAPHTRNFQGLDGATIAGPDGILYVLRRLTPQSCAGTVAQGAVHVADSAYWDLARALQTANSRSTLSRDEDYRVDAGMAGAASVSGKGPAGSTSEVASVGLGRKRAASTELLTRAPVPESGHGHPNPPGLHQEWSADPDPSHPEAAEQPRGKRKRRAKASWSSSDAAQESSGHLVSPTSSVSRSYASGDEQGKDCIGKPRASAGRFDSKSWAPGSSKYTCIYRNDTRWAVCIKLRKFRFATRLEADALFELECECTGQPTSSRVRSGWGVGSSPSLAPSDPAGMPNGHPMHMCTAEAYEREVLMEARAVYGQATKFIVLFDGSTVALDSGVRTGRVAVTPGTIPPSLM